MNFHLIYPRACIRTSRKNQQTNIHLRHSIQFYFMKVNTTQQHSLICLLFYSVNFNCIIVFSSYPQYYLILTVT